MLGISLRTQK